ncbi:hypothetical protein P170DRAFT_436780 [Aspergillus steynii IBT 23096]|uniref:Uncharacterized protein n=1 Tax=Aspergillus steynii IBT 23096 TaxID=1392250 RepID=A0A2I2G8F7_9EURO|nr:uncharacterized protein P170DRAFT_436780 [Aspergillus steynii IBT 23096]PLB49154.1 hypothetical protein P170DRAFT_436780 [Aspergillus steynii IBT 23096]
MVRRVIHAQDGLRNSGGLGTRPDQTGPARPTSAPLFCPPRPKSVIYLLDPESDCSGQTGRAVR